MYGCWKQGQAKWKDYRDAVRIRTHREKIPVAKAQLELKLATSVGDNKKFSFKYMNRKRRARENIDPLLDGEGHLTDKDIGKAKMFNAFFASVFNAKDGLQDPGCPELENRDSGNDKRPTDPQSVCDLLLHLDPFKSMGVLVSVRTELIFFLVAGRMLCFGLG